jgi:hypothetical protein
VAGLVLGGLFLDSAKSKIDICRTTIQLVRCRTIGPRSIDTRPIGRSSEPLVGDLAHR